MRRSLFSVIFMSVVFLAGCAKKQPEQARVEPPAPPAASQPARPVTPEAAPTQPEAAPAPAVATSRPDPAPAPAAKPRAQKKADRPSTRTPVGVTNIPPAEVPAQQVPVAAPAPAPVPEQPPIRANEAPVHPPVPATPPAPALATIAAGTRLDIRLNEALDSAQTRTGATFHATLEKNLIVAGKIVAPAGSAVTGKIVDSAGSGKVSGRARMIITLVGLQVRSDRYEIRTNDLSFEADNSTKSDATKVGGAAGLGAIIGAIAGGGKGAAIGAAIGGAAGTATVLSTKGKEVKFDPEDRFSFELRDDIQVKLR